MSTREGASPRKSAKKASPGRPALRELAKQRTRQALIDAGLELFSQQGLEGPSLDAICERAGCTRGAFYVHFGDRDALIAAAMATRRQHALGTLLGAADLPIEKVLELFASAMESGAFPLPGAVRSSELVAACRRSKTLRAEHHRLLSATHALVTERLERDQAEGRTRTDVEARSLALLLLLAEAGAELLFDLGFSFDARGGAAALSALLRPCP